MGISNSLKQMLKSIEDERGYLNDCERMILDQAPDGEYSDDLIKHAVQFCDQIEFNEWMMRVHVDYFDVLDRFKVIHNEVTDRSHAAENGEKIYRGLSIEPQNFGGFREGFDVGSFCFDQARVYPTERTKEKTCFRGLGRSWTWDRRCARYSGARGALIKDDLVIVEGTRPITIDTDASIERNFVFNMKEKELTLQYGTTVHVNRACRFVSSSNVASLKYGKGFTHRKMKGKDGLIEECEILNRDIVV